MIFSTGKFLKSFTGSNIWGYVFLVLMMLSLIYYMKSRFKKIEETSRGNKVQSTGVEYFAKQVLIHRR